MYKNKYLRVTVILSLLSVLSYGENEKTMVDATELNSAYYDLRKDSGQKLKTMSTSNSSSVEDREEINKDKFVDTVIYNDIYKKTLHGGKMKIVQANGSGEVNGLKLATPATDMLNYMAEQDEKYKQSEMIKKQEASKEKQNKPAPIYSVGGYCTVGNSVKIVRSSEFTVLDCLLDFGSGEYRNAQVFAGVYPNYKKEVLVMLPIYATFENQNKGSFNGIVMTASHSSLNIADSVERFKIRRLVGEYGLDINDVAYRYATLWLTQSILSRTETRIDYIPVQGANGTVNTPIVTSKVAAPSKDDFWAMAGAELVTKLFSIGAENLLKDSSPLFTVNTGKRVWVEGVVSFDAVGIHGKYGLIEKEVKQGIEHDNKEYNKNANRALDRARSSRINSNRSSSAVDPMRALSGSLGQNGGQNQPTGQNQ